MPHVLTSLQQLTPEWLTALLVRQRLLIGGRVLAVATHPNPAFNSTVTHLTLTFSPDAPASVPRRLLLKQNLPEAWARPAGVREAQFYQLVAQLPDHPPMIVPCVDAAFDPETGDSHLLLYDLSDSHAPPITRDQQLDPNTNVPAHEQLEAVVDTLARFHAFWWQHPRLGSGVAQVGAWRSGEAQFTNEVARRRRAWDDLWAHEHDWFPAPLRAMYETIFEHMVALWKCATFPRLATFAQLTLTHGDAYFANFLCPRPHQHGPTYLIDWQSPEVYRGTSDVVNLCATFWNRAQRAEHEGLLLNRYREGLLSCGVVGYAWEALVADYQYSIIDWLLQTLQDRLDGAERSYWFTKMQCLAAAYDDWHCAALFPASSHG